jgi:hypothetical protein
VEEDKTRRGNETPQNLETYYSELEIEERIYGILVYSDITSV